MDELLQLAASILGTIAADLLRYWWHRYRTRRRIQLWR